jgi:hypothetical protein
MALASITSKIIFTILLVLILGGGSLLIAGWVRRLLQVRADKKHSLKLVNNGNCPSHYYLSARSTQPDLAFTYLFKNIPLAPVLEEIEVEEEMAVPETQVNGPAPSGPSAAPQHKAKPAPVKPAGAIKAGRSVAAKSGLAASLLGTLGGILPGKLGAGLKEKADLARNAQIKTAKVTQAPQTATNKMDAVKGAGGKLGVRSSVKENASQGSEKSSIAAVSSPNRHIVMPVQDPGVEKVYIPATRDTGWVQTGEMNPGDSLLLTLRIGTTAKRYPSGSFIYDVRSQQIPEDGSFAVPAPVSKTGTVYFKPVSIWRYWIPKVGSSLVLLLALLGIFYGLTYLWG